MSEPTATPRARGRLLLLPTPLDFGSDTPAAGIEEQLPLGVMRQAAGLAHWVAENARSARLFLKRVGAVVPLALPIQQIAIAELPRPSKGGRVQAPASADLERLLAPALQGHALGLVSEAGLPGVADPGAALVRQAHGHGIEVVALPGASSLMLALAASGLNGQSFAFVGYLPQESAARAARIAELETLSRRTGQTQLLIETPYRNPALLAALLSVLQPSTRLSVSCGLTLADGFTRSQSVRAWRTSTVDLSARQPAVFALQAE